MVDFVEVRRAGLAHGGRLGDESRGRLHVPIHGLVDGSIEVEVVSTGAFLTETTGSHLKVRDRDRDRDRDGDKDRDKDRDKERDRVRDKTKWSLVWMCQ